VCGFMIEPHNYELHGLLNTGLGSLLHLRDGPFRHWLKGDLGVLAPEAYQHILRQGTTHCLQLATDDLLQLQHLGPSRVKQWKCGADLFHRIPGVEGTKAEGHQRSFSLAQKVLDHLCLTCPGCLELLQPSASDGQLLELPFYQSLFPVRHLFLPVV
jgi:hypothetical protein